MAGVDIKMEREDVFKMRYRTEDVYKQLEDGIYSEYESDNFLVKKYLDAKFQGHYKHILYDCNAPEKTVYKNMIVLKKIITLVKKPLKDLTEDDVINLQNMLNHNRVMRSDKNEPIAYSYKYDIIKNLKQFWSFYRAYCKYEEGKEIPNITEYLRIRKEKNANRLVEFLKKEEIEQITNCAKNLKMRSLIKVFFETGARTIEILNLRKFNCSFQEGRWTIKLPNMKGISTAKMPIELEYSHTDFNAWMHQNDFSDEDYIFDYAYDYFRITLTELGKQAVGRRITPKLFRKSCAMHLVNLDINEQYIKSHMGWSASSKAISHYISQKAIKKPDKLKTSFNPVDEPVQNVRNKDNEIDELKEEGLDDKSIAKKIKDYDKEQYLRLVLNKIINFNNNRIVLNSVYIHFLIFLRKIHLF